MRSVVVVELATRTSCSASKAVQQIVYLHGFASSPESSKAQFLKERLGDCGVSFVCPDLNEPDFSTLTTSRMITQVADLVAELPYGPITLIGSSLGAFVALCVAEHAREDVRRRIDRLVLLAPALDFGKTTVADLGADGMAHWQQTGWWELNHHAFRERRRVHYELFRDAQRYDTFAVSREIPTLILQGSQDDVVDPRMVSRFAEQRPHVSMVMLDDDHRLGSTLDRVWSETARFLDLAP